MHIYVHWSCKLKYKCECFLFWSEKLWEKAIADLRSEGKGIPWCLWWCSCRMWLNLSSWVANRTALVADGSNFRKFSVRCRFEIWWFSLTPSLCFVNSSLKECVCVALFVCFCFHACSFVPKNKKLIYLPFRKKRVSEYLSRVNPK